MRIISILVFTLFIVGTSFSQKVDIDRNNFYVEYATLPLHKVEPALRTYTMDITGSMADRISGELGLRGWEWVESEGDAHIELTVFTYRSDKAQRSKNVKETKDKDGKVTGKKTYYKYASNTSGRAYLKIWGPLNEFKPLGHKESKYEKKQKEKAEAKKKEKQEAIDANPFLKDVDIELEAEEVDEGPTDYVKGYDLSTSGTITSKEYTSAATALAEYNKKFDNDYYSLADNFYDNVMQNANLKINEFYGYNRKRDWGKFKKLDSRKHPENEMYNQATEALKTILAKKRFNKSHDEIATALDPIVTYFESVVKKYGEDDKQARKLKSATLYNLAQIHYYLDRPEKVIEIGNEYIRWGHDEKDGERFIRKGKDLKHLLAFHGVDGRYFETDEDADAIQSEDENQAGNE